MMDLKLNKIEATIIDISANVKGNLEGTYRLEFKDTSMHYKFLHMSEMLREDIFSLERNSYENINYITLNSIDKILKLTFPNNYYTCYLPQVFNPPLVSKTEIEIIKPLIAYEGCIDVPQLNGILIKNSFFNIDTLFKAVLIYFPISDYIIHKNIFIDIYLLFYNIKNNNNKQEIQNFVTLLLSEAMRQLSIAIIQISDKYKSTFSVED